MQPGKCLSSRFMVEQMTVFTHANSVDLGICAAERLVTLINAAIAERGNCSLILATGNSQLPLYAALREHRDIPWEQVTVLHMDEYLGLSAQHPASFRRYMHEQLVDHVPLRAFYGIEGDRADVQAELRRYTALLRTNPADVCVLGIGENGHLAFNDPPADFTTADSIHVVNLDQVCRQQQVGEGHFKTIAEVPAQALSLTVPALLAAKKVMALVPETRKAAIVRRSLTEPVSPLCPATILRTQPHAALYLDADSASLVQGILK